MRTLFMFLLVPSLLLAGCSGYPRDPEDSLQRARTGVVRVGVSHDPPHVIVGDGGEPHGSDIALVRGLAAAEGARVEWVELGHDALMRELLAFRLHLVVGGHHAKTPWQPQVAWSREYPAREPGAGPVTLRRWALPPGENAWQLQVDRFLQRHEHDALATSAGGTP
jgi:ABC-type amino acid transport substrate-binding protein